MLFSTTGFHGMFSITCQSKVHKVRKVRKKKIRHRGERTSVTTMAVLSDLPVSDFSRNSLGQISLQQEFRTGIQGRGE